MIKIMNISITSKIFLLPLCNLFLSLPHLVHGQPLILFLPFRLVSIFQKFIQMGVKLGNLFFFIQFLSFSIIILRVNYVVGYISGAYVFIAEQYSMVLIYNNQWYIQLLMNIGIVSSVWLLQRKLLWTFLFKSLYKYMFSFLVSKFLDVEGWTIW